MRVELRRALLGILLILGGAGGVAGAERPGSPAQPEPPAELKEGQRLYATHCGMCHGVDARGTDKGPPFLTKVYTPDLHADIAFQFAVERGVRAHHWRFGDMPRTQGVSREETRRIVEYVRWLQRQAGVY